MSCSWLACVLLLVCLHTKVAADAPMVAPIVAIVQLASEQDRALLVRVRGQISDLSVTVIEAEQMGAPQELSLRLSAMHEQLRGLGGEIGVWFTREGERLTVYVSDPAQGRLLAREVQRAAGAMGASTQQEAAALIVRGALRARLQGEEIGVPETELVRSDTTDVHEQLVPSARQPSAPRADPPAQPVAPAARAPCELSVFIGASGRVNSASERPAPSLSARLAVDVDRLRGELRGELGLSSRVPSDLATLELARHSVSAHAAWLALRRTRLQLALAVGGGLALFRTRAKSDASGFDTHAASASTGFGSADATLEYRPGWASGQVGLALLTGVELYPHLPRLGYLDTQGRFVGTRNAWPVQPTLAGQLWIRWP
ncbi:MAG: hypothetical protein QM778_23835 [Myxococcales bacterium]